MDNFHNNPPSAAELFLDEALRLTRLASEFGPVTEANAGEARDLIGLAKALAKDIEAKREEEKRPHIDAGRQIDATYKPIKEAADKAADPLTKALMGYINEQKRLAAEAAEKARKAAEEEARRAAVLASDPLIGEEAVDAAKLAEQRAEVAQASVKVAATVKGSEGFRAAGVVKSYRAKVIDYAALVLHYGHHPDVQAAAEKLANAAIRAAKGSITIPGVEVETIESLR
jgi:hypothetical protein